MFGRKRRSPIELVAFSKERPQTFNEWLCDGVTAHNVASLADLLALHAQMQAKLPDFRILSTLDDLDQACYTSGHAVDANELDSLDDSEDDLDSLPDFAARLSKLTTLASDVSLDGIAGRLPWATPGEANDLVSANRNPEGALQLAREKEIVFQYVPVAWAADAVAAFPNGYFNVDLDPMQNHVLASHLERNYALRLVAIGSRFLAFQRDEPLDQSISRPLAAEMTALYADTPNGAAERLSDLIIGRTALLLRYTES